MIISLRVLFHKQLWELARETQWVERNQSSRARRDGDKPSIYSPDLFFLHVGARMRWVLVLTLGHAGEFPISLAIRQESPDQCSSTILIVNFPTGCVVKLLPLSCSTWDISHSDACSGQCRSLLIHLHPQLEEGSSAPTMVEQARSQQKENWKIIPRGGRVTADFTS